MATIGKTRSMTVNGVTFDVNPFIREVYEEEGPVRDVVLMSGTSLSFSCECAVLPEQPFSIWTSSNAMKMFNQAISELAIKCGKARHHAPKRRRKRLRKKVARLAWYMDGYVTGIEANGNDATVSCEGIRR